MNSTEFKILKLEQHLVDYFITTKTEYNLDRLDALDNKFRRNVTTIIGIEHISCTIIDIAFTLSTTYDKGRIGIVDLVSSILNLTRILLKNED